MFTSTRSKSYRDSFSGRINKSQTKKQKASFRDHPSTRSHRIIQTTQQPSPPQSSPASGFSQATSATLNSPLVTIVIGSSQRLFAAHEDVLVQSPHFADRLRTQFFETGGKRVELLHETPEVFSAVLEFLYKGDYSPKLLYDRKRASWYLEDDKSGTRGESMINCPALGGPILKDTMVYVSGPPAYDP